MTPRRLAEIRRLLAEGIRSGSLVRELLAHIDTLEIRAEVAEHSAAMACENPPDGCRCPGCLAADVYHLTMQGDALTASYALPVDTEAE